MESRYKAAERGKTMKSITEQIKNVEKILEGTFADESDRKYWEDKLAELRVRQMIDRENQKYFHKNRVYDR